MITLKNDKVAKVINVPTTVNEVTPEVLEKLSANIYVAKYYSLVALCWNVSFADIFFNQKSKEKAAQVIPLLAKMNVPDAEKDDYKWLEVGKKLVLSRSAIEMGVHIHVPNAASMQSIQNWAEEVDKVERPTAKGLSINTLPQGKFILIEFKVIPVSQISGVINGDSLPEDPFLVNG